MDQADIQQRIETFLKELKIPGFIVFGYRKNDQEFGFVYSLHQMPTNVFVKGMSWALHDFVQRSL
jgi:hypothetical protein